MNTMELLKLGQAIRNTSRITADHRLKKTAQGWGRTLAGGLAGSTAGWMTGSQVAKASGNEDSWWAKLAPLAGAAAGGLGGAAAFGGGNIPAEWLQHAHRVGGNHALPVLGGTLGALGGATMGSSYADTLGLGDHSVAAPLLGAALGGLGGASLGTGLGQGIRGWAGNRAKQQLEDQYGRQLGQSIRTGMLANQPADPTGLSRFLPSRIQSLFNRDPGGVVEQGLVSDYMQRLSGDRALGFLGQRDPLASLTTQLQARGYMDPQRALNLGQGLGINTGLGQRLTDVLGADTMGNLRTAGMLGGAYMGASALGDLYSKYRRPQPQQQHPTGRKIMVL